MKARTVLTTILFSTSLSGIGQGLQNSEWISTIANYTMYFTTDSFIFYDGDSLPDMLSKVAYNGDTVFFHTEGGSEACDSGKVNWHRYQIVNHQLDFIEGDDTCYYRNIAFNRNVWDTVGAVGIQSLSKEGRIQITVFKNMIELAYTKALLKCTLWTLNGRQVEMSSTPREAVFHAKISTAGVYILKIEENGGGTTLEKIYLDP